MNVHLFGVHHGIAQDIDLLLVGPGGQNIVVMSDVANGGGFGINNANITFDDDACRHRADERGHLRHRELPADEQRPGRLLPSTGSGATRTRRSTPPFGHRPQRARGVSTPSTTSTATPDRSAADGA